MYGRQLDNKLDAEIALGLILFHFVKIGLLSRSESTTRI